MPTYELALLLKALPKPELGAALKRAAVAIFQHGGIIRRIDNLGEKATPFKIGSHGVRHKNAHYFIVNFDSSHRCLQDLRDNYRRDVDVIRTRIYLDHEINLGEVKEKECTLHEDLLPPPYRKSVQEMLEARGRKLSSKQKKFDFGPGLDYNIF